MYTACCYSVRKALSIHIFLESQRKMQSLCISISFNPKTPHNKTQGDILPRVN